NYFDLDKDRIFKELKEVFGEFDDFIAKLTKIVTQIGKSFERVAARPDLFFEYLYDLPDDQFCYGLRAENNKSMMVSHYELHNAALFHFEGQAYRIKEVLETFHASVLFSATIGNVEIFKRGLGLEFADFFSSSKFNTDNFKVILKRDVSSLYKNRKDTAPKIVDDVNFCKKTAGGVLLALPSKATSFDIVPHVQAKSLDVVDKCKDEVYYAILSGKSSRGINKAHNLNIVYVYGLQLPQPTDYLFQKRRDFMLKKYDREIAYKFLYSNVVSKACQVAGRIFRKRGKKGLVVFADSRYRWDYMQRDFFYNCFPAYFKDRIIETNTQKDFQNFVSSFWGKLVL
ncbi:helicase C-terminal domain-containing protein, partial [Nanoarchaeota archaeon]